MKGRLTGRAALLLAALLALCPAVLAEGGNCPVQLPDTAVLVNQEGADVILPGEYSILYEMYGLPEGLTLYAGARQDDFSSYALVDADGRRVTEFDYRLLEYRNGGVLFVQDEGCGFMDEQGQVLIAPEYSWLLPTGEGGWLALKTDPYDDSPDSVYCVAADGTSGASGVRIGYGLYDMGEGLSAASDPVTNLYGYIGPDGQWAIQPAYDWAGIFADGLAQADSSGKTGLIDRTGRWVIAPEYDSIQYRDRDSLIMAGIGNTIELLDAGTLEKLNEYTGEIIYGYLSVGGGAVLVMDGYAVIVSRSGGEIARLEGCLDVSQWDGMDDEVIAQMGEYGTPSAYLYSADGSCLAGPYQNIMPLGSADGETYYTFVAFDAEQVEYEEYGMSFWDEIPGTRRCGVIAPDGRELCAFDAEYISFTGENRMLIQTEDAVLLADFSGNVLREFANNDGEEAAE